MYIYIYIYIYIYSHTHTQLYRHTYMHFTLTHTQYTHVPPHIKLRQCGVARHCVGQYANPGPANIVTS